MGGISTAQYRVSVGYFYVVSLKISTMHLSFINVCNIKPFLLLCLNGADGILPALLLFVITSSTSLTYTSLPHFGYDITESQVFYDTQARHIARFVYFFTSNKITTIFFFLLLMLLCGDVHPNPGPLIQGSGSNITVVHNNICSLQNKVPFVEAELTNFDIITLSETWLYESFPSNRLLINGYHPPVRLDRTDDAHGGVAIYVKEHLYCKHRPDLHIPDLEAVWIETKINQEPLLIGCFYRTPSSLVSYWDLVDESINLALRNPHKAIILGDFNKDCLLTPHRHVQRIMNLNNLHQLITEWTRKDGESITLIDLILTPCPEIIERSGILPAVKSDHRCVYAEIKNTQPIQQSFKRTLYIYSKLNEEDFLDKVGNIDWNNVVNSGTVDIAAELFSKTMMDIAKTSMPVKTIIVKNKDAPWITQEIKKLIKKKHNIHAFAKLLDSVWSWNLFKQTRNRLVDMIRNRKDEYQREIENRINSETGFGTKDWWKMVNNFFNRRGLSYSEIPALQDTEKQEIIYLPEQKAELFNFLFIQQSKIEGSGDILPLVQDNGLNIETIIFSNEMVSKVIKELDQSKAVGPDLVHNKLLVKAVDIISGPLAMLFNRSIT